MALEEKPFLTPAPIGEDGYRYAVNGEMSEIEAAKAIGDQIAFECGKNYLVDELFGPPRVGDLRRRKAFVKFNPELGEDDWHVCAANPEPPAEATQITEVWTWDMDA